MKNIDLDDLTYFKENSTDFKRLSERFDDVGAFLMGKHVKNLTFPKINFLIDIFALDAFFENVIFYDINLTTFDFSGAKFKNCIFSSVSFKNTNHSAVSFKNCIFENCNFINTGLFNCEIAETHILSSNLTLICLNGTKINKTLFSGNHFDSIGRTGERQLKLFTTDIYIESKTIVDDDYSNTI